MPKTRRIHRKRGGSRSSYIMPNLSRANVKKEVSRRRALAAHAAAAPALAAAKRESNSRIKATLSKKPKNPKHKYGSLNDLLKEGNNA